MIEDKIQKAIKPIISIYSQMELDIIEKIAEHFKLNEEFINSDYWYFEKLKELGGLDNKTIKLLEEYTGKTKQELLKAMQDIGIGAIPTEQLNIAKNQGILFNPQIITIQNIIQHSYNEIENTFLQLNKTIEEQVKKTYTDIATQAYIKTSSGMYSYQEAILQSLDELGNKGISTLTYQGKNGNKKKYDVVGTVRRDLLCATRGLVGKVNEEVIKESGNHIVRVSHHFGARTGDGEENYTNHAWWQEKQFFCWNYDGKATEEEKKVPDFMEYCNYGDVQGIVGINCKHFFTVWYGPLEKDKMDFTYEDIKEQARTAAAELVEIAKLKAGDIVNIDVTSIKDGYYGDTSRMFVVGKPTIAGKRLADLAFKTMWAGIDAVRPGGCFNDIGRACQAFADENGISVVRDYGGHGIGRGFHEEPHVNHFPTNRPTATFVPGMVFTVEPMVNAGRYGVTMLGDGWTVVTRDRSLSAQWEHMVLVTETGYDILTVSKGTQAPPDFVKGWKLPENL